MVAAIEAAARSERRAGIAVSRPAAATTRGPRGGPQSIGARVHPASRGPLSPSRGGRGAPPLDDARRTRSSPAGPPPPPRSGSSPTSGPGAAPHEWHRGRRRGASPRRVVIGRTVRAMTLEAGHSPAPAGLMGPRLDAGAAPVASRHHGPTGPPDRPRLRPS
jgi:hypothetical protein